MNLRILFAAASTVLLGGVLAGFALAETWERFRGPGGDGVANKQNLPTEFDEKKNLLWKIALPGQGNSSPVVWNDQVFVQCASPDGSERLLLCLDAKTGKKVWEKTSPGVKSPTHSMNTLASSTPATDGKVVAISSYDGKNIRLLAYSMKGEPLWEQDLGAWKSEHGPGASPVIYKDKVFFLFDMDGKAVMHAFDKATGKPAWTQPRDAFRASYSAPQFLEKGPNGPEMIITTTTGITSYNLDSGSRNWNYTWSWPPATKPLRTIAGSLEKDGMLFAMAGDGGGARQMVALTLPTVQGAAPVQAWDNLKDFPYVPCALMNGGHIYFVNDKGFAGCFDAKTGKKVWYERLAGAKFTGSPVLVDGKIYAGSEEGDMWVLAAEPKYELIARNTIGERMRATPAVADGRMLVRGERSLFCFGKK